MSDPIMETIQLIQEARALRAEAARLRAQLHAARLEARQIREAISAQLTAPPPRGYRLFRNHVKLAQS